MTVRIPLGRTETNNMGSRSHWRIASATSAGSAHLKNGLPNQDAVFHALVETSRHQVAIAAVADGAGSATRSDEGSQIAAAAAVNDSRVRDQQEAGNRLQKAP